MLAGLCHVRWPNRVSTVQGRPGWSTVLSGTCPRPSSGKGLVKPSNLDNSIAERTGSARKPGRAFQVEQAN